MLIKVVFILMVLNQSNLVITQEIEKKKFHLCLHYSLTVYCLQMILLD